MSDTEYKVGGVFTFQQIRDGKVIDEWDTTNIVVNEGLSYIMQTAIAGGTAITNWYLGLFKNNYTPIANNTLSSFPTGGVANEATTEYSEATRVGWTLDGEMPYSTQTNNGSPATFTFLTGVTIYGALLASSSTKGSTTGTLLAASKFTSAKVLVSGDSLTVKYTVSASST